MMTDTEALTQLVLAHAHSLSHARHDAPRVNGHERHDAEPAARVVAVEA